MLGFILGSPYFGKLPNQMQKICNYIVNLFKVLPNWGKRTVINNTFTKPEHGIPGLILCKGSGA